MSKNTRVLSMMITCCINSRNWWHTSNSVIDSTITQLNSAMLSRT